MNVRDWARHRHRKRTQFIRTLLDAIADSRANGSRLNYERVSLEYFRAANRSYVGHNLRRYAISFERLLAVGKRWQDLTPDERNELSCRETQPSNKTFSHVLLKRGPKGPRR